ncbi:MAG: hypothetical protein M0T85_14340 [Dehalococcoidales bacterium]|nr:hypothetical protein [Dehalococcoidales bacterium]
MKGKIGRRLYHIIGGCIPPLLGLALPREWLLLFLGIVSAIFVMVELLRITITPLNRFLISIFSGPRQHSKRQRRCGQLARLTSW